jgi:S1-C subfamily serine protease
MPLYFNILHSMVPAGLFAARGRIKATSAATVPRILHRARTWHTFRVVKRNALYCRATRTRGAAAPSWPGEKPGQRPGQSASGPPSPNWTDAIDEHEGPAVAALIWGAMERYYRRHERLLLVAASVLISIALIGAWSWRHPPPRALTQNDIDGAVQFTLSNAPRAPADSARAAAVIAPSVVEVQGFLSPEHAAARAAQSAKSSPKDHKSAPPALRDQPLQSDPSEAQQPDAIGSGVVVDQGGSILTSLHVVSGTDHWVVVFADGSQSEADFVGSQPENDLAVLKARRVPDEQKPAVLASTAGLRPGDQVVATGFPFGMGPSVSAGVVSGLKREFVDAEHDHLKLTNLIQFDAAVNPGNSGGPLVNRDGEVVGIVTAIVNPSGAGVFAGIAFAVPIENAARAVGDNPL